MTPKSSGLRIEALDCHANPRVVPWSELERIGIELSRDLLPTSSQRQRKKRDVGGVLDQLSASIASLDNKLEAAREVLNDLDVTRSELSEFVTLLKAEEAKE